MWMSLLHIKREREQYLLFSGECIDIFWVGYSLEINWWSHCELALREIGLALRCLIASDTVWEFHHQTSSHVHFLTNHCIMIDKSIIVIGSVYFTVFQLVKTMLQLTSQCIA